MDTTSIVDTFILKLTQQKGHDAAVDTLLNISKFGAAELYTSLILMLTDEDLDAIEKIENDEEAEKEMAHRFKLRTGVSPDEFMIQLQEALAKGYLANMK